MPKFEMVAGKVVPVVHQREPVVTLPMGTPGLVRVAPSEPSILDWSACPNCAERRAKNSANMKRARDARRKKGG